MCVLDWFSSEGAYSQTINSISLTPWKSVIQTKIKSRGKSNVCNKTKETKETLYHVTQTISDFNVTTNTLVKSDTGVGQLVAPKQ